MKWLDKYIAKTIKATIEREIDKRLPAMIMSHMAKRFPQTPDRPLSHLGFIWAFALSIIEDWPDVTPKEAASWLEEYMPSTFGDPEYDWTYRAAKELADNYVMEFGEMEAAQ